ncbi:MAG: hypothetical protein EOO73_28150 [Myxococcales bacterium]|nr:MAG: hypothetical protein EOO73_28150 [Myxococcales bacterium]
MRKPSADSTPETSKHILHCSGCDRESFALGIAGKLPLADNVDAAQEVIEVVSASLSRRKSDSIIIKMMLSQRREFQSVPPLARAGATLAIGRTRAQHQARAKRETVNVATATAPQASAACECFLRHQW